MAMTNELLNFATVCGKVMSTVKFGNTSVPSPSATTSNTTTRSAQERITSAYTVPMPMNETNRKRQAEAISRTKKNTFNVLCFRRIQGRCTRCGDSNHLAWPSKTDPSYPVCPIVPDSPEHEDAKRHNAQDIRLGYDPAKGEEYIQTAVERGLVKPSERMAKLQENSTNTRPPILSRLTGSNAVARVNPVPENA